MTYSKMILEKKANIFATIVVLYFVSLFAEPIVFNTFYALMSMMVLLTVVCIRLMWWAAKNAYMALMKDE